MSKIINRETILESETASVKRARHEWSDAADLAAIRIESCKPFGTKPEAEKRYAEADAAREKACREYWDAFRRYCSGCKNHTTGTKIARKRRDHNGHRIMTDVNGRNYF